MLKSDLLKRLALNVDTAEEYGPITEVWVNGRTHQVRGIGSGGGLLGRPSHRFLWSQVAAIGQDGVMIKAGRQPSDGDVLSQESWVFGDIELWSDHGDRLGQVTDFRFDPATGNILQYHFVATPAGSLDVGLYALAPLAIVSMGRRRMMMATSQLPGVVLLVAGTPSPTPSVASRGPLDQLPLDRLPDPRRGWQTAVETSRQAREQVADQFEQRRQNLQRQTQAQVNHWLGQVKKRTRRLRSQLRETVTDVTAGLPSGRNLQDDQIPTIDVDAMELWGEEDDSGHSR
ncbi:MAG TPA: hypothetical protein IGR64_10675 [Leptolyngbyaceae cyanobacterium M65_K2018_010]|nr:hypothetical protein [Leptolyngbyaceae cyanobacterium M65_K2018_010]